jgi:hypothetical protein
MWAHINEQHEEEHMVNWQSIAAAAVLAVGAQAASAQTFSGGIPAGWVCAGNCGAAGADGVVTLAPSGGSQYGYVTTAGGVTGVSPFVGLGGETTGSKLTSTSFAAAVGDSIDFRFNYITSDGAGFADYAWARLIRASDSTQVAILFTARTRESGSIIPGFGLPAAQATINPTDVGIIGGGPAWSPLAGDSGRCWSAGCGYTGWVNSTYELTETGSFRLEFGVVNWDDELFQSGMAFDGITIAGVPLIPEPETYALMLAGLGAVGFVARRRKSA